MKLEGALLSKIFMGGITKWNDPEILKLNPGLKLPDMPITVVHRSDASGTTWNFTNYLAKVSEPWAKGPGCAKEIAWPCGIGAPKNAGVANQVNMIKYSIGYVESAFAFENDLTCTQLKNGDGNFVLPTKETFKAAAATADWKGSKGFFMVLTNQPGEKSWPIMAATYILMQKDQPDQAKAENILKFFDWAYTNGSAIAEELNYVPLPQNAVESIRAAWKTEIKSGGNPVIK
jgi:phosphate transport system substrate-binding protein